MTQPVPVTFEEVARGLVAYARRNPSLVSDAEAVRGLVVAGARAAARVAKPGQPADPHYSATYLVPLAIAQGIQPGDAAHGMAAADVPPQDLAQALLNAHLPLEQSIGLLRDGYAAVSRPLQAGQVAAVLPPLTPDALRAAAILADGFHDDDTPDAMTPLLAQGGYPAAATAPAIRSRYGLGSDVDRVRDLLASAYGAGLDALGMAKALAAAGFRPDQTAKALVQDPRYHDQVATALLLGRILQQAYALPPIADPDMAKGLAAAAFPPADAAQALLSLYPSPPLGAAALAADLQGAYPSQLSGPQVVSLLEASGFGVLETAQAVAPRWTFASPADLAVALEGSVTPPAPAAQLALALQAAGVAEADAVVAIKAAIPDADAMLVVRACGIAYDPAAPALVAAAWEARASGDVAAAAAALLRQGFTPPPDALAAVLSAVYAVPPTTPDDLGLALHQGIAPGSLTPADAADALLTATAPPALPATSLAPAVAKAVPTASATDVATVLKANGYAEDDARQGLLAAGFPQDQADAAVAAVYSQQATCLDLSAPGAFVLVAPSQPFALGRGPFTLEAWVKGLGPILGDGADPLAPNPGFQLASTPQGLLALATRDAAGNSQTFGATTPTPLGDGAWHHVAVVRDVGADGNAAPAFYLDGVPMRTFAGGAPPLDVDTTQPLVLGSSAAQAEAGKRFAGALAEVRLWGVARTRADILNWMGRPLPAPQPGLLGYWPLRAGSAADASGAGNDGQLQGSAAFTPGAPPPFEPARPPPTSS